MKSLTNFNNLFIRQDFKMNEINLRPPGHGNNCNGHYAAIEAGGRGHWEGDSCGCFGSSTPAAPIDMIAIPLLITAIIIIKKFKTK